MMNSALPPWSSMERMNAFFQRMANNASTGIDRNNNVNSYSSLNVRRNLPVEAKRETESPSISILRKKQKTETMIFEAINALKKRNGSSLQAIRKYIKTNYKVVDSKQFFSSIKRTLKLGIGNGNLIRIKRSYKLSASLKKKLAKKKPKNKKTIINLKIPDKATKSSETIPKTKVMKMQASNYFDTDMESEEDSIH